MNTNRTTLSFLPAGELHQRLHRNFDRLESEWYFPVRFTPEKGGYFQTQDYSWPGDTEGRVLLAWVLLERVTGRKARFTEEVLAQFPHYMNGSGYFGAAVNGSVCDEQQLGGHGWVFRALCEHWKRHGTPEVYAMLERLADNLILPREGLFKDYPIDPQERKMDSGSFVGEGDQQIGAWRLSTDIGAVFVLLDGLVQAEEILKRVDLQRVIEKMIARFLEIDIQAIQAQTHASLTALRGILRWYAYTGRSELLAAVEQRFRLYCENAASENHANWNWFGRPTHTEPCAVVDAFMIAIQLWNLTKNRAYLEEAHRIYYSAIGHGQRQNGGFGCDSVLGGDVEKPDVLSIKLEEATWCCTMRGGEGLAFAAESAVAFRENRLLFSFFHGGTITLTTSEDEEFQLKCTSDYPWEGKFCIEVCTSGESPLSVGFFVPSWGGNPTVTRNGKPQDVVLNPEGFLCCDLSVQAGDNIEYRFDMQPRWEHFCNKRSEFKGAKVYLGPLLYGSLDSESTACVGEPLVRHATQNAIEGVDSGVILYPVNDVMERPMHAPYSRRAMWQKEP
jgi:hypothetical protein